MPGSQTSQSPVDACAFACTDVAFRIKELRQHSDFRTFRGSMAGLHVPLSTLHVQPCDCPRMTRGQVGSLRLTCTTLSFATPRRFIPAHSQVVPKFDFFNCVPPVKGMPLSTRLSYLRVAAAVRSEWQISRHLARLTLARKIAAITLLVWKKGVRFDAKQLKQQAA
jgi:hypothetical protein